MFDHQLVDILNAGAFTPDVLRSLARQRREQAEVAIEILIEALDALDGDTDLEPDHDGEPGADDEPCLGSVGSCIGADFYSQTGWARGGDEEIVNEDGDPLDDGECDESDREPFLGSFDDRIEQADWAGRADEQGHGDREQDGWRRPNLVRNRQPRSGECAARRVEQQLAAIVDRQNGKGCSHSEYPLRGSEPSLCATVVEGGLVIPNSSQDAAAPNLRLLGRGGVR